MTASAASAAPNAPVALNSPAPIRLLIAEDEEHLGAILEHFLRGRGHDVTVCRDGRSALAALESGAFEVALTDVVMPEMDGLEVLRHLQRMPEPPEVIIITGNGSVDTAINAIALGAYDYIAKPYRMAEVDAMVRRAWEKRELRLANAMLRTREGAIPASVGSASQAMSEVLQLLASVAERRLPLLIEGEPGSGKSYLARHVHTIGHGARDAFVEVSHSGDGAAAISRATLFGRERSAIGELDDGDAAPAGSLILAARGTVAVDLEQLEDDARDALLIALREGWFRRVGGTRQIPLTAQVILMTRDASEVMSRVSFDSLGDITRVVAVPLRNRMEDMDQIARALVTTLARRDTPVSSEALEILREYDWPGNVGELSAVLQRALLLAPDGALGAERVRAAMFGAPASERDPIASGLGALERAHIETVLVRCGWHQGRAAVALGISTKTLYRKMREYGFKRPPKRKLSRAQPDA